MLQVPIRCLLECVCRCEHARFAENTPDECQTGRLPFSLKPWGTTTHGCPVRFVIDVLSASRHLKLAVEFPGLP